MKGEEEGGKEIEGVEVEVDGRRKGWKERAVESSNDG